MAAESRLGISRWWLVVAAAGVMGVAGSYQFVWSSIRTPIGAQVGATEAGLGTVFTLFVVFQTVSQFPAGWVRDRYGPRVPLLVGAVLLTAGYAGTALATTLPAAYLTYSVGGVGTGVVYTVAVNTPVKWFTERRGFATSVVAMSYSGTSFLLIPFVRMSGDVGTTLFGLGALAGLVTLLAVPILRDPEEPVDAAPRDEPPEGSDRDDAPTGGNPAGRRHGDRAYTWRETLRTWQFWLLYGVFVAVNGVGLMLIGKVVSFAEALALPASAATGSASLIALADASGVIVVGDLSDRLGAERTIAASLVLCGVALAAAVLVGGTGFGLGFVALVAVAAFFRSPAFGVFPSLVGEYYGAAHSSQNYAALYTAKLWGGVFGGAVASALIVVLGWSTSFLLAAGFIALAGVAAAFLEPVS